MRQMVRETIEALVVEERKGDAIYEVTLLPFSSAVQRSRTYAASAVPPDFLGQVTTSHPMGGQTALQDAIGEALSLVGRRPEVPALVSVFTDGDENASYLYGSARLAGSIADAEKRGNVTITVAGPQTARAHLARTGIPAGNFRAWDGSQAELVEVARQHVNSTKEYVQLRSTGATRSGAFYADASAVTPQGVRAMTKLVTPSNVRAVPPRMEGRSIPDFYGSAFRKGHHYYQLVKPEYLLDDKELVIKLTVPARFGEVQDEYRLGSRAVRAMLGLPETGKIRITPSSNSTLADGTPYELYVRSDSGNRKVVAGQKFITVD